MSIHFISGKPGGGKSLYGVKLILDELIHGSRVVVTNVPLKLANLNDYIQQKYPVAFARRFSAGLDVAHISEQIILLTEEELPKFFTFRGGGVRLNSVSNAEWRQGVRPDFSTVSDSGVFYVLDEVHIAFNSRAWADTGAEVLYYLSQHRKLGDDVICITQSIGNVDKQFRSVAQDFTYLKNLSKQRAGFFRLPSVFLRSTYAQPATDNSKAMESGSFTLDVTGLASCYDTARGVGIHGRAGADKQHRKKGFHWAWFVVGMPLAIYLFLHFAPELLVKYMNPQNRAKPAPVRSSAPVQPATVKASLSDSSTDDSIPVVEDSLRSGLSRPRVSELPVGDSPEDTNRVTCSGIAILSKEQVMAFFSDGSTAYGTEGEIQKISGHWVYAFGKRYRLCASPRSMSHSGDDYSVDGHIVDVGQNSSSDVPVNDAEILPAIHSQVSAMVQTPRINGLSSMSLSRQPQAQGEQSSE